MACQCSSDGCYLDRGACEFPTCFGGAECRTECLIAKQASEAEEQ